MYITTLSLGKIWGGLCPSSGLNVEPPLIISNANQYQFFAWTIYWCIDFVLLYHSHYAYCIAWFAFSYYWKAVCFIETHDSITMYAIQCMPVMFSAHCEIGSL